MNPPADAGTTPYRRILVLVVVLILYGSLYPWQFHARYLGSSPLWVLLHTWPGGIDRYVIWDVAINVALYLPLGIFGFLSTDERWPAAARFLVPLLLAVTLSSSVEMLQLFDDSRTCSLSDLASNATGAAIGIAAGALYRTHLQRLLQRDGPSALLRPSGTVLLLCCWLGYQVFPLFPSWGRTNLFRRMAAMGPWSGISPVETLVVMAEWLAVACLLESILKRHTGVLLALLLLMLPGRLIIAGRALSWADVAGAVAACAIWGTLPRLYVRRAAPILLAGALLLAELAPFHFVSARAFSWLPFRGMFRSSWQDGFVVLFRKSFWYGSAIWLWGPYELRLATVTAGAALALFFLERVQIYLPGRTPEITDVVLALLMGLLLWLLRDV